MDNTTTKEKGHQSRGFRVSEDSANKIKEIQKATGFTQDEVFQKLTKMYEMENAKSVLGDRKAEIEQFDYHVKSLVDSYLNSLQMNEDTEDRVYKKFESKLESNQLTIEKLQGENARLLTDIDLIKKQMAEMMKQTKEDTKTITNLEGQITAVQALNAELEKSNTTLSGLLAEHQEFKNENERLRIDNGALLILNQKANTEMGNLKWDYQNEIIKLKSDSTEQIAKLKEEYSNKQELYLEKLEALRQENYKLLTNRSTDADAVPVHPVEAPILTPEADTNDKVFTPRELSENAPIEELPTDGMNEWEQPEAKQEPKTARKKSGTTSKTSDSTKRTRATKKAKVDTPTDTNTSDADTPTTEQPEVEETAK